MEPSVETTPAGATVKTAEMFFTGETMKIRAAGKLVLFPWMMLFELWLAMPKTIAVRTPETAWIVIKRGAESIVIRIRITIRWPASTNIKSTDEQYQY
jgi:hypothetical protein